MTAQFNDLVMRDKKARFLAAVKKTVKHLGLDEPAVEFRDEDCPFGGFGPKTLAHCHLQEYMICVPLKKLEKMTFEEVDSVAKHEVTHLTDTKNESNPHHSGDFYRREESVKRGTWAPPSGFGIIHVTPRDEHEESLEIQDNTPEKVDKLHCHYHLCRKRIKTLHCKHCNNYFCAEHITPMAPFLQFHNSTNAVDIMRRQQTPGHPCPEWSVQQGGEKERKEATYREQLKQLSTKGPSARSPEPQTRHDRPIPQPNMPPTTPTIPGARGIINITVYDKKHTPQQDIEITLTQKTYLGKTITGPDGKAQFARLENGKYGVTVSHEQHVETRTVHVEKGHAQVTFYIGREPAASPDSTPEPEKPSTTVVQHDDSHEPNKRITIASVIILLAIIAVLVYYSWPAVTTPIVMNNTTTINNSITVIEPPPMPVTISYVQFIRNPDAFTGKNLTLSGFLLHALPEGQTTGVKYYYLVDDDNLRIRLESVEKYDAIFKDSTNGLYTVNGVWVKRYYGYALAVTNIMPTQRETINDIV